MDTEKSISQNWRYVSKRLATTLLKQRPKQGLYETARRRSRAYIIWTIVLSAREGIGTHGFYKAAARGLRITSQGKFTMPVILAVMRSIAKFRQNLSTTCAVLGHPRKGRTKPSSYPAGMPPVNGEPQMRNVPSGNSESSHCDDDSMSDWSDEWVNNPERDEINSSYEDYLAWIGVT